MTLPTTGTLFELETTTPFLVVVESTNIMDDEGEFDISMVGIIGKGEQVLILEYNQCYVKVLWQERVGWIEGRYVTPVPHTWNWYTEHK